jgi:acetate kinase
MVRLRGFDADQLEDELSHRSGLSALSNGVTDMRELLAREATDDSCRLAVAVYCYEIKKRIGAFAAALGGLDALVFSGGIGEHAPVVRARICEGLAFLGVGLAPESNSANAFLISAPRSSVAVHVIAADEEIIIARAAYRLLH